MGGVDDANDDHEFDEIPIAGLEFPDEDEFPTMESESEDNQVIFVCSIKKIPKCQKQWI